MTSQAFEVNAGIQLRLLHNDMWNNSGGSIIPNRALWPRNTIGGHNLSQWLHIVGDRNCMADNFFTPGRICADVDCRPPIRPRGGLEPEQEEPTPANHRSSNGEVTVRWWATCMGVAPGWVVLRRQRHGQPNRTARLRPRPEHQRHSQT